MPPVLETPPMECVFPGERLRRNEWCGLLALLLIHAGLLAWLGATYSPTYDEPGHLAAGYRIWTTGRIDLYSVNPPLVKTMAAAPLRLLSPETDWRLITGQVGFRPEFMIGRLFLANNPDIWWKMMTLARWACIPLSLLGAVVAFHWARQLFGRPAGWVALILWTFDPNLLGNGCLITPDVGGSSLGLLAGYTFWRWLQTPDARRAFMASACLALALLTKSTLLILGPAWIAFWGIDRLRRGQLKTHGRREALVLLLILMGSAYGLNLGYGFQGTGTPLKEFEFVSRALMGDVPRNKYTGNRFRGSWTGELPVMLPSEYVRGLDLQKKDFDQGRWSYLAGELKWGGWWYFYLVAIAIKSPLGYGLLLLLALMRWGRDPRCRESVFAVGLPLAAIVAFVSAEQGFTSFVRYVLPGLPYGLVLISGAGVWIQSHSPRWRAGVITGMAWVVISSVVTLPHSLGYFNELVGGSSNGYHYLIDANLDWGQDLGLVKEWIDKHPEARPVTFTGMSVFDSRLIGLNLPRTPDFELQAFQKKPMPPKDTYAGWHIVSVTALRFGDERYAFFNELTPVDRIGYSTLIYYISPEEADLLYSQFQKLAKAAPRVNEKL
ncbi:MAG: hypothetical protein DWH91_16645 [Planctomycetota bacterium]|nr:MAG: hypothetical protein DWH91_16645 [Planctomycetota bacterium]